MRSPARSAWRSRRALQHQAATGEQGYRSGIHLLWRLAHRPRWVAGLAASVAGLALHAAALHAGALAVVQPLLVMGLAFALPLRALLDRARPPAGQALAAAVLAARVAIFVAPPPPPARPPPPPSPAAPLPTPRRPPPARPSPPAPPPRRSRPP